MSDLALIYDGQGFDLALDGDDLLLDHSLQTAVVISLFSDRRARADDAVPGGSADRRGWWGDAWAEVVGDQIGSRLWLLSREKELPETLRRAREYAEESLAWLVRDGIASTVTAVPSVPRTDVLRLDISIRRREGGEENFQFDVLWEAL